ncbi:MAG TPA: hypothetical protein V6D47_07350 [Oscillatoriaceae cyanobacterium]
MPENETKELIHAIVAVEAEMAFVEALLRQRLTRAEQRGDAHTVDRIRAMMA